MTLEDFGTWSLWVVACIRVWGVNRGFSGVHVGAVGSGSSTWCSFLLLWVKWRCLFDVGIDGASVCFTAKAHLCV